MTGVDPAARHRARAAALQMLYQAEVGRAGAYETIATYWRAHDAAAEFDPDAAAERDPDAAAELDEDQRAFANDLVRETMARVERIDQLLAANARNWRVERMAVIDRLVLRLAVAELMTQPETPHKVVINEAIELARTFSGEDAVAFVNGVLDAVRKELDQTSS